MKIKLIWLIFFLLLIIPTATSTDSMGIDDQVCFDNGYCYTIAYNDVYFENLTTLGDNVTFTTLYNTTIINVNNSEIINASCTGTCLLEQPTSNTSLRFFSLATSTPFTNCTGGSNVALQLNMYQEFGITNSTNSSVDVTISLHPMSENINYSWSMVGNNTYYICIDNVNASYSVDAHLVYYGDGFYGDEDEFEKRTYFLINATLTNTTRTADLYQIRDSESDRIDFFVQDQSGTALEDYYIDVQRYYVDENIYRTVTILRTDAEGLAQGYLASYDYWYRFIIKNSIGTVVEEIDAMTIKDTDITFTVESTGGLEIFDYYGMLAHSCSFNNNTGYLYCTISDASGMADTACLKCYQMGAVTLETICETCNDYSGGMTMGCNIPDWAGDYWYCSLYLEFDESYLLRKVDQDDFDIISKIAAYGTDGLLLAGVTLATVSAIGFWNPAVAIVISLAVIGISWYMGLMVITQGMFAGLVVIGLILIFKMRSK